jgi:glycosyltransferase involved in cell wall biosynthesis
MSQMVDHVVGVSRFTLARHLVSGYFQAARQVHVIHNGLPGNLPTAPRHKRPERPLQLGYVGQITPVKGIRELISQMGHWQSGQCELLVAGKGATAYEAMLRAEAPKNVRFLGFVDPHQLYGSIDLLVVPSLWEEPLATTVLEAYMHGVPVIVSRRGGLPEMVDEGRTGLVYEPLRPEGLRKVVEVFIRDPQIAHDMHPLVLEKARDFLVDRMQVKYLHLFENAKEISTIKDQPRQLGRRPA